LVKPLLAFFTSHQWPYSRIASCGVLGYSQLNHGHINTTVAGFCSTFPCVERKLQRTNTVE
jgi:hypothetical protein